MTRPTLVIAAAAGVLVLVAGLACVQTAHAASRPYTVASQAAGRHVTDPTRFGAIIGYADQCVQGIKCWTYTKGTRSPVTSWPERWYLHVAGERVRDKTFGFYVMDPRSRGWERQVARACPRRCFLDGLGPLSLTRTAPHVPWTQARWVRSAALIVRAVVATGKHVLPNSVGTTPATSQPFLAAAGRGSSEQFSVATAAQVLGPGRIWVAERGQCAAKYTAYQWYRGRGDHFACFEWGRLPWDTTWMLP